MIVPEKLDTKRLELCPYKKENFDNFMDIINNEYCINYLNIISERSTQKKVRTIFSSMISSYTTPNPNFVLKILNKRNTNFIGTCGLILSRDKSTAECFYALLPSYQGNGYAIEAMLKLFEYSFNILKLSKIFIYLHSDNSKSWKVAERIGMKYMGQRKYRGVIPKAMLFTISKKEYESQRKY